MEKLLLIIAAVLEVGGDALIRSWFKTRGVHFMLFGAASLVAYGFFVNWNKLDFGRLMGIYIAVFFVVAQLIAVFWFKERLTTPVIVGGLLVIAGGVTMTVWQG